MLSITNRHSASLATLLCVLMAMPCGRADAQLSETEIARFNPSALAAESNRDGSAARGAVLFHRPMLACGRCHSVQGTGPDLLGPNLAKPLTKSGFSHLWQSLSQPSENVDPKYKATQILTADGEVVVGMLLDKTPESVRLKLPSTLQEVSVAQDDIEEIRELKTSLMPAGLLQNISNRRDLLDLLKYLTEIQSGGTERARELQPTAAQLAIQLPEYEANIDHAGFISQFDSQSLARGEKIYTGLCVNCHGTKKKPGSLATALRFGQGKFKHGGDPYSMYQTLTRGTGLMLPQPWMVPQQKYDVIHYIREHFLAEATVKKSNINQAYLTALPLGTDRGPEPREIRPWSQADYGPRLINTYEIGRGARNIAQKGIAIQLDQTPGGIAQGSAWAVFDHDTMRLAGVWTSGGFIDWQGIHFDGRHGIHPHAVGDVLLSNPTGPGWAEPQTGSLSDAQRVEGRDGRRYGPLPRQWAQYKGLRQQGRRTLVEYTVGGIPVVEYFQWQQLQSTSLPSSGQVGQGIFSRHLKIAPHTRAMQLVVARADDGGRWKTSGASASAVIEVEKKAPASRFDGQAFYESQLPRDWDTAGADFSVVIDASVKSDGTLFSIAPKEGPWAPGGQTLFVRGGRLAYDVGWVGSVTGPGSINDGTPHRFVLTFSQEKGMVSLWVDGKRVAKKLLQPNETLPDPVVRVGRTSGNFPATSTLGDGRISSIALFNRQLINAEIASKKLPAAPLVHWKLPNEAVARGQVSDRGLVLARKNDTSEPEKPVHFGAIGQSGLAFEALNEQLLLNIPASETPVDITAWTSDTLASNTEQEIAGSIEALAEAASVSKPVSPDLFPEVLTTQMPPPVDTGEGFAIDVLTIPEQNPWLARVRLTGVDFYKDPDRLAVCTWDGDVWEVSGLSSADQSRTLTWRRIAFGLFQPLGLQIIDEQIYLTCRDQLVRLEDTTGDGLIDYYNCLNNDHQVTEHFHEFAMGLQTDAEGNFYYAKSARHAKTAVVPHHGTLLRISADGEKTDILATGFRAANGVCLNPDGSFIVTDQEGHWNPKNRINWVYPGGFYGNMYGYHDVTDSSDNAMEQPLCWITNAFDRSPAELLWCDSPKWGPLQGTLLNMSYGYGKLYVVPHEQIGTGPDDRRMQGGMCSLPIPEFPTGLIRGRFSPHDQQLYVCGLSAWASSQTAQEGGLYRIRYTGQPAALPLGLSAKEKRIEIILSEPASQETSLEPSQFAVRAWELQRTKNYGSKHYNEQQLGIQRVELSADGRTLTLHIPKLNPTWSMEIQYTVRTPAGKTLQRIIHNTIHSTQ